MIKSNQKYSQIVKVKLASSSFCGENPDIADKIVRKIDGKLQRIGIVWPRHQTAEIIREVIRENIIN